MENEKRDFLISMTIGVTIGTAILLIVPWYFKYIQWVSR